MSTLNIKTSIKIGIAASLAIILFQVSNIFLVYKYFKFDYYITAIAILFLVAGYFFSRYTHPPKAIIEAKEDPLEALTLKEIEILKLIATGKSNKEIAAANFVEISTIKTHINNIYGKLGITNRKQAINWFNQQQAIVLNDDL